MEKTFYIVNLGCSKNQVDGETVLALMEQKGWKYTDLEHAHVVIINTCGFINDAKEESINTILNCKSSYPDKIVIAAGCLAQRYGKELSQEMTEADGFVGNHDLYAVPDAVEKIVRGKTRLVSPKKPSPDCFVERSTLFTFPIGCKIRKLFQNISVIVFINFLFFLDSFCTVGSLFYVLTYLTFFIIIDSNAGFIARAFNTQNLHFKLR